MSKNVLFWIVMVLCMSFTTTILATVVSPIDKVKGEETYLLLAHKWESGKIYLDLNINGSFEGNIDGKNNVYGNWEITNNERTLVLTNEPIDEDEFKIEYILSDVSFDSIKLVDKQGKTTILTIADN